MNTLTREIESIKEAYAALNRNDIQGFMKICDPQITRVEWEGTSSEGSFQGFEAVTEHVSKGRATWAEGGCTPVEFAIDGNNIIVSVHVRVRLKDKTDWNEGHVTDVFTFKNGKATQFRSFFTEEQALAWVKVVR